MHDRSQCSPNYEPPRLTVLGSVHGLTQVQDKKYGHSDGLTFMGNSITNNSPSGEPRWDPPRPPGAGPTWVRLVYEPDI
jgi:hypothetical protein